MDIGMIVRERDSIAKISMCSTRDTTTSTRTTTWKTNNERTRDRASIAEDAQIRSSIRECMDTSRPRPEHQQHAAWPDHNKDEEPAIEHRRGRADYGATLGSFRLQSTCRYQRSREDVCPQHKATGHVSKYVNSRCAIENCLMSARNIRATAHAPCSQHTFNRNLELKTDQFHGVYRLVTPST